MNQEVAGLPGKFLMSMLGSRIQRQGLYKRGIIYETPGTVYRISAVVR